jgi:hypothetical protein
VFHAFGKVKLGHPFSISGIFNIATSKSEEGRLINDGNIP